MTDSIRDRRVQYESAGLDVGDLAADPIAQWHRWYAQAEEAGCVEPNAMVVSTIGDDGIPDSRYVLARGVSDVGFAFYTNYDSAKSAQLEHSPGASALFTWLQLHRQMKIRGTVAKVSAEASDAYFAGRPRSSQIGAWASPQSEVLADRAELDARVAEVTARFADTETIPRPPFWGGWLITPVAAEVWQGRPSRLHDRFRYRLVEGVWIAERLAP
ncbi:MAG: pdxH [Ilumatobacteraceae bacterium]|nr:pdxH [Ilumatobacteraceae bacterium]